jgi:methionyl-tRNA formyltransferase
MADTTAVVFAYSEVGARCLRALYDAGVSVPLVITHRDDPREEQWFASVARLAAERGSQVLTPDDPREPSVEAAVRAARPDFVFSFYYRHMLPAELLAIPRAGALNMHGSLLPKYRGRAPVNWAILHGETQTGASLHFMTAKPDAGALVDQQSVPIGPDDTAVVVADRVADAAVAVLQRSLPALIAGTAKAIPLDLSQGSYFGGRRPSDGEFHWDWPAARIHNLVRAVAPPFPGAFASLDNHLLRVHKTRLLATPNGPTGEAPAIRSVGDAIVATCGDGNRLELSEVYLDDAPLRGSQLTTIFGCDPLPTRPPTRASARATSA